MKLKILQSLNFTLLVSISISSFSQVATDGHQLSGALADSLKKAGIIFNEQKNRLKFIFQKIRR
jgi:hypothetical protein